MNGNSNALQQAAQVAAVSSLPSLSSFSRLFLTASSTAATIKPAQLASQLRHLDGDNLVGTAQAIHFDAGIAYGLLTITQASFKDLAQQRIVDVDNEDEAIELINDLCDDVSHETVAITTASLNIGAARYEAPELLSLGININTLVLEKIAAWPQLHCVCTAYELVQHPFAFNFSLLLPESLSTHS